jgi:hypothetical protein
VTLVGTDQLACRIECEPLLVVRLDEIDEFFLRDREAALLGGGEQNIHWHPAARLEHHARS